MKILTEPLKASELSKIAETGFGFMVKAVVDIDRNILAIDAELHSDLESLLIQNGSKQKNLWGINLLLEPKDDSYVEFDSMINVRPQQNNRSRGVEDAAVRASILKVVSGMIVR